ncbi:hypothetical protein ABEV00_03975 [Paenibacillus thiaminolyticus]|uniref:hypothetical protein n=1 Tax=Paenibacillus TaxID=44249 RepID=UPI0010593D53|nr:hypothetical protein [Paenibacillus dendritiformis]TDL55880.1 hypothetical protein E2R60_10140 [Paenibacillus dendritiformis]
MLCTDQPPACPGSVNDPGQDGGPGAVRLQGRRLQLGNRLEVLPHPADSACSGEAHSVAQAAEQ